MTGWLPVPTDNNALDRVRQSVHARIRRRRTIRRAISVAAALAMIAITFWPKPAEIETLALRMPQPPPAPVWVPPQPTPPIILAQAPSRPAERITIYTDDPDVVIILVAEGGAE